MLKSFTGTAGALVIAALVLTGCGHDKKPADASSAAAPAAVAVDASTGAEAPLPEGVLPSSSLPAAGAANAAPPKAGEPVPASTVRPAHVPSHLGSEIEAMRPAWIEATVTRGGSGPCYGVKGSDGTTYAAWSAKKHKLSKGTKIHVQLTLGTNPVDCGAGEQARMGGLQLAG